MEHIRNKPSGACASITFYQFVKLSGNLSYENLKQYVKSVKLDLIEDMFEDLCNMENIINKYWIGIQNNVYTIDDLPDGGNMHELNEKIKDMRICGESEYGCISLFCRIIFYIHNGFWVGKICNNTMEMVLLSYKIDDKLFDNYLKFMLQYTETVPYITYCAWIGGDNLIENMLHVCITFHNGKNWTIHNSNDDEEKYEEDYVNIWFCK